jgi:hypothetical protein
MGYQPKHRREHSVARLSRTFGWVLDSPLGMCDAIAHESTGDQTMPSNQSPGRSNAALHEVNFPRRAGVPVHRTQARGLLGRLHACKLRRQSIANQIDVQAEIVKLAREGQGYVYASNRLVDDLEFTGAYARVGIGILQ